MKKGSLIQAKKALATLLAITLIWAVLYGGYYWGYRADSDAAFRFSVFWLKIAVLSELVGLLIWKGFSRTKSS